MTTGTAFARAIDQLALLVLQAGSKLGWDDVVRYITRSIDMIVQLSRTGGVRRIEAAMLAREGGGKAD